MKDLLIQESNPTVYEFISRHHILDDDTLIVSTSNAFNLKKKERYTSVINFGKVNNVRFINKFFEEVNSRLPIGALFFGVFESFEQRKKRKKISKIPILRNLYYAIEFLFLRVLPKIKILNKIYFSITRGRRRLLSEAEVLGRLYCCGFQIVDLKESNNLNYFIVKKIKEPTYDMNASYSAFYKMPRVGKNGKTIGIYKMRTMHPYSEYLQEYIYNLQGTDNGDKANDDFRVTPWGKFFRKFWIDELPMLINLLKGEVKIIGVRPLSKAKFNLYPPDLQEKRIKFKPGLIPPFYADIPQNFEELVASEHKYLDLYQNNKIKTDIIYFCKAFKNIVIKGTRSK